MHMAMSIWGDCSSAAPMDEPPLVVMWIVVLRLQFCKAQKQNGPDKGSWYISLCNAQLQLSKDRLCDSCLLLLIDVFRTFV